MCVAVDEPEEIDDQELSEPAKVSDDEAGAGELPAEEEEDDGEDAQPADGLEQEASLKEEASELAEQQLDEVPSERAASVEAPREPSESENELEGDVQMAGEEEGEGEEVAQDEEALDAQ